MDETSSTLLAQVRDGRNHAAWQQLLGIYEPFVKRKLLMAGLASHDVDDLCQEVMLKVFSAIGSFDRQRAGSFRQWLRIIAHNTLCSWARKPRETPFSAVAAESLARAERELADESSQQARNWDEDHDKYISRRLLDIVRPGFSDQAWKIFHAYAVEGQSVEATAKAFGTTAGAVYSVKSRVLKRAQEERAALCGGES